MPVRPKTSTTRLPQSLLEEIVETTDSAHPPRTWHRETRRVSRTEARKQARLVRKQHKAVFFSAGIARNKRLAEEDHVGSIKRKKAKYDVSFNPTVTASTVAHSSPASNPIKTPARPLVLRGHSPKKGQRSSKNHPAETKTPRIVLPRPQKEAEEDRYIRYLEGKLKHGMSGFKDDGLDDLLNLADSIAYNPSQDDDGADEDQLSEYSTSSTGEGSFDEWPGIDNENDFPEIAQSPSEENAANGIARYIPPHLRRKTNELDKNSEETSRLTRQLKGLLNRMSEENMITILDGVEDIYRNYRRNDVTYLLTMLVTDTIASHSSLLDSYVVLHAAFVSSLHKILGLEFAAHFVQHVVSSYECYYTFAQTTHLSDSPDPPADEQSETNTLGKECSNLVVLLSELYNFQVISSILIFDITRGLLENNLTEFGVELLLKIVQNSGQQLRQDDPSALAYIIQIVQSKVNQSSVNLSSRTRFMIETLSNTKNQKLKRNTAHSQGGDAVERMNKFLSGLAKKRHVLAHEPLRVSLDDLHSAETKGKWWLVGAAWGGDPLMDRREQSANAKSTSHENGNKEDNGLLRLAQKHGMNTDIRRSIFVVLMSSDDYVDACERLSQLNLTEIQQREIIRVLLHCCGNERSYNPYYTLVCQHLCRISHSYKITLQFCLWDFFRDLGEPSVGGSEVIKNSKDNGVAFDTGHISLTRIRNVARAYAWWIAKDCLILGILKPVDFTSLKPQTQGFLREMLVQIFIASQVGTPILEASLNVPTTRDRGAIEQIFIKGTRNQTLAMGLVYFMSKVFCDVSEDGKDIADLIQWASGLAKDTLRIGVDVIPAL